MRNTGAVEIVGEMQTKAECLGKRIDPSELVMILGNVHLEEWFD
jgi:hypothetical protein